MIPNRMRPEDKHCGPVALALSLGITPEEVMQNWPTKWSDPTSDRKYLCWPIDTPWLHREYVEEKLGRPWILKPKDAPLESNSIALVHNVTMGNPWWKNLWDGFWGQHWVLVRDVTKDYVTVDWGTESSSIKIFTKERFDLMTKGSWPYCIYKIGG